jgi:hypothetical protein
MWMVGDDLIIGAVPHLRITDTIIDRDKVDKRA